VVVVGTENKKKMKKEKEATRTTKESDVTRRNLRKKGTVMHR
jgi:hypothetical protein